MTTVGTLSPERHFSRDQRTAPRRHRLMKDAAHEVTSGSSSRERSRHPSTIRDFEVGVGINVSQVRPWTASTAVVSATTALGTAEGAASNASRGLEERFRAVNINDNNWVHVRRVATGQNHGVVPIHPLQRPDAAVTHTFPAPATAPREASGVGPGYRCVGMMGVTAVENAWPPLVASSRKGAPTPVPAVTPTGSPAVISPTAASGGNPVTIAPLDARDTAAPIVVPRRVPRSLSCDGWIEPARGLPLLLSESVPEDSHHKSPGDSSTKHINNASPSVVTASTRAKYSNGASPTARRPLSPSTPRSRPRAEDWNRTKASTPPPPPTPSVRTPPKQQRQQHQQPPPVPQPQSLVHARHRYPPWDGNMHTHPVSPQRQPQQQQQQQQQMRQRHTTAPYEAVYWRQAPPPPPPPPPPQSAHQAGHRPMHVILTHAEHQMILQHQQHQREQYQHQLHLQREQQIHHREQAQQQHQQHQHHQQKHHHQHQHQQVREYPPPRDQPLQRGLLLPRDIRHHQHHQQPQREHRRGRPRSENERDAVQGPSRRRPSPTPQENSRRASSPPPASGMGRSGAPPPSDWQRHVVKRGGMQQRNPPRPFFYPSLGSAVTAPAAAGPGGMPGVQVLGHAGYPRLDSSGHPMHVTLAPGSVPIISIVAPALFSPYAVITHVPVQRRTANGGGGGVSNVNGGGMSMANGNSNGHGNDSVTCSTSSNDAAASAAAGVGGSVANGALHIANGGGGVPVAGDGPVSGGGGGPVTSGGGGSRTVRVRVPPHESHKLPSAPTSMIVKVVPRGSTCDNRVEIMARAPSLEMKRRAGARQSSWKIEQPGVIISLDDRGQRVRRSREGSRRNVAGEEDDIGVDFGDFGVDRRIRAGESRNKGEERRPVDGWGPRSVTGPVPGGWDYDGVCTGSESCTGTISSVERPDGAGSCTLSSCSEEAGAWNDADGAGSVNESRAESTISASDGADEAEAEWPTELRNSIGIVTDLVVPCQTEIVTVERRAENGRNGSGSAPLRHAGRFGVSAWDSECDEPMENVDEEEREMLDAMQVFYRRGKQQLQEHADRHKRSARQRATDNRHPARTPAQQNTHRRTQR